MSMETRRIGPLTVSAIGLGCMNLSHGYGPPPAEAEAVALLNRALDLGCTFLDTAAIYGVGGNERLLNRAVMHRRSEFTLASKCVLDAIDGKRVLDARPETIRRTLDDALLRLGTDRIDLYYLHRPDPQVPIEESVGELSRAIEAGKIRTIGLSEMNAPTIRRAHAVYPIAAVQSEYSPWVRNPEIAVLGACRELGIGFVAFSPVGRGMLTGTVRTPSYASGDMRNQLPRFQEPHFSHNLHEVARFETLAANAGVAPAQLALGWVLSRDETIVPIPGTRNIAYLEENLATAAVSIDDAVLAQVDALFTGDTVHGGRYSRDMQAMVTTETFPGELG
ncbi:aldo/keto reductase [Sphingomonas colocasiae]|uniref:Aldo/keto reductase n=1 Tax=Sphingomonas colocasiae TaxID=1848973 RepID=A0ABS7PIP1_9SPHN|nr:aldo/keto reductase [Sphingomonas colocasiae]MBY8821171.1 aldo/keto reductase [Sphingomonas colocasiae]